MKLYDSSGNVVELPWDAVCFLLDSYRDRRTNYVATRPAETAEGYQWTVNKSPEAMLLYREADQFSISRYAEVKNRAEMALDQAKRTAEVLQDSIAIAEKAERPDVVAEFNDRLLSENAAIKEHQAVLDALEVPKADRLCFELPADPNALTFFEGEKPKAKAAKETA